MRFRICVDGAPDEAVGWFTARGHDIVTVGADMVLCGSKVPMDLGRALVVSILADGDPPDDRADVVIPAPPSPAELRRVERLADSLRGTTEAERADGVHQALERAMEAVISVSPHLPSVYFLQGDRLRCVASRRYYQILDGFPLDASVIGEVVRTGEALMVDNRDDVKAFATAQDNVRSEIGVPLWCDGRVIGAFNIESEEAFDEGAMDWAHDIAGELERAVAAAGGLPPLSEDAQLGLSVTELIQANDRQDVHRTVLTGLQRLSGMSTAVIVRRDAAGSPFVANADGPLAGTLRKVSAEALEEVNRWVEYNSSCFSVAPGYGEGWLTSPVLAGSGARSVSVHRMASVADGFLICADEEGVALVSGQIQRLEVLAITASGVLSTVDSIESLERMAWQDPLTGLGHRGLFEAELGKALQAPRLHPLAVLMIDVDRFKRINDEDGHQAGDDMLRAIAEILNGVLRPADEVYRIGGDEFAAVAEVKDGDTALALAERMCAAVRDTGGSVSIGVAVADAAVRPTSAAVVSLADEALYAAKRAGRDCARLSAEAVSPDAVEARPSA